MPWWAFSTWPTAPSYGPACPRTRTPRSMASPSSASPWTWPRSSSQRSQCKPPWPPASQLAARPLHSRDTPRGFSLTWAAGPDVKVVKSGTHEHETFKCLVYQMAWPFFLFIFIWKVSIRFGSLPHWLLITSCSWSLHKYSPYQFAKWLPGTGKVEPIFHLPRRWNHLRFW